MNKRFYKIISCLVLFMFMFLGASNNVKAAVASATSSANTNAYAGYSYTSNYWKQDNNCKKNCAMHNRKLEAWIFYVNDGKTTRQAYCLEQSQRLAQRFTTDAKTTLTAPYDITTGEKWASDDWRITLLAKAMSVGYQIPDKTNEDAFRTAAAKISPEKAIAKQEIMWEIFSKTRTNFSISNNYAPKKGCTKTTCPFYYLIKNTYPSALKKIYNEYAEIIKEAHYTFEVKPSGFGTQAKPKEYNMDYDGKKFVTTLTDANKIFKYFEFKSSSKDVTVTPSSTGDKITITSSKPLDKKVTITMTNNRSAVEPAFYHNATQQDVGLGVTNISYYLTVSTPEYQLKINKKDKLHGNPIKGATFQICSDSACSKSKVLATVTTDDKGVATYNKIDKPGTYYIKETKVPAGYVLDSTPKSIKVTTSNIAGSTSFAEKTVTNKNNEFNLTKYTIDENGKKTILKDGCGSNTYTGPLFEIKNSKGENLYFKQIKPGEYEPVSKSTKDAISSVQTCNGKFKIYTLTECKYSITETKAPDGLTLPGATSRDIDICNKDKSASFTNGFTGLEFQKKDEDGNFIIGGKFALQQKVNNVYKDMLLKEKEPGAYEYDANLKETSDGATYIMLTNGGVSLIKNLPPGEYRVVEKEAPNGYELISDKDSNAIVTITDSNKEGYYLVEMINHKVNQNGSQASAELIVTIITGRKVLNYVLIISGLVVLLVLAIIVRKKIRK